MKVMITHQFGTNMGDRAMCIFMLNELIRNGVKDITVSTHNPYYWRGLKGYEDIKLKFVPFGWSVCPSPPRPITLFDRIVLKVKNLWYVKVCVPLARRALADNKCPYYIKWFTNKQFWNALNEADLVLGMGGHRITTLLVEDAMISATYDVTVAHLLNKPVILWSQTIGPLNFVNPKNKELIANIIKKCKAVYIRDKGSRAEIEALNIPMNNIRETRDSVFALDQALETARKPSERENIVGVSLYITRRNLRQKKHYIDTLTQVIDYVASKGYHVKFFPMSIGAFRETRYMRSIISGCNHKENISIVEGHPEVAQHMQMVSECKMFIGHKTHSVIFALATATPLLAIAYQRKTSDFMEQFGLSQYCVDDKKMDGQLLIKKFDELEKALDSIYKKEVEWMRKEIPGIRQSFKEAISSI